MSVNMDDLMRLHQSARNNGIASSEFQKFQIRMYELFPDIYKIAVRLTENQNPEREHKVAVLIKSALDLAAEVDGLKVAAAVTLHEKERIQGIVERTYDACEQLGAVIGVAAESGEEEFHL